MATKGTTKTTGTKSTTKAPADKVKTTTPKTVKAVTATVLFQKSKETPGTFAYRAVDSKGKTLDAKETACAQIYVRKDSFKSGPEFLRVTIEELKVLPKEIAAAAGADDSDEE